MSEVPMRFVAPLTADLRRMIELLRGNLIERLEPPGSTVDLDAVVAPTSAPRA
jgi:hypothetical protein